jgi:large subunit ribosomal protein L4
VKLDVFTLNGKIDRSVDLPSDVFGCYYNEPLVCEVINSYRTNGRAGTVAQLSRAEVRGGGAKPWRQKGTGRARAGTIRSPLWRGGGVTFAASPREHYRKVNRKVYRKAIKVILSKLYRENRILVLEEINVEPKTKKFIDIVKNLNLFDNKILFVVDEIQPNFFLAARNVPNVEIITVSGINPLDLVKHDKICISFSALQSIERWLR